MTCRWLGTGTLGGLSPFHTAGVQFILFRTDIIPYGHSNIMVLDNSVDGVINETFTCRVTVDADEYTWNTTIVQPRKFIFINLFKEVKLKNFNDASQCVCVCVCVCAHVRCWPREERGVDD